MLNAVNSNVNGQANNASQALQQGQQAVNAAQAVQPGSLAELLMQRTGVTAAQAQGGAGALFQVAKSKMQPDAFAQLEQSVPGMNGMLGAAASPITAEWRFGGTFVFNSRRFGWNGGEFGFGGFRFSAAGHVACDGATVCSGGD